MKSHKQYFLIYCCKNHFTRKRSVLDMLIISLFINFRCPRLQVEIYELRSKQGPSQKATSKMSCKCLISSETRPTLKTLKEGLRTLE